MANMTVSLKDFGGEPTRTAFRIAGIGAGAGEDARLTTAGTELQAGILGVTNGQIQHRRFTDDIVRTSSANATLEDAQRERKMVVYAEDDVTFEPLSLEIGTVDVTKITVLAGTEQIDLAAGGMAALVAAIETHHLSKLGNAVTVTQVKLVGRNL